MFQYLPKNGLAQNLIPNPSFEVYDTCPSSESQPNNFQLQHALGWQIPTLATSDYFNICNTTVVGVPTNFMGYQVPKEGNAYAGFGLEFGPPHWFEYIQTTLNSSLIEGNKYKFSFYVNLANGSDYALEKIGAWFTPNVISSNNTLPLFSTLPQIENTTSFITDTVGWTKVEGEFIAKGGENYLTIGYYSDTNNIDTLRIKPFAPTVSFWIYYYVDGITLEEVESTIVIPNIITPNSDGTNDLFQLNFQYERTTIYNRWGQQLFESNNNESYWNGRTTSGKEVPDGTYFYIITTKEETYKGFVQVIR
ncbi:MAG: gliding motility-associated C-terminal domain-containing protein [Flavobacteriales bacterium]|nr:gliding motility-associated C-terminal domain-containing protein [Flavobacteriales bacterium]